jgi:hypothetical protein
MVVLASGYHLRLLILGMLYVRIQNLSISRCFLEQESLHQLLSTDWFQARIRELIYKLTLS